MRKKAGRGGRRGTASLCSISYYSCAVAFCRGGSAEPAGGAEDQRYHHHSWPEHRSDVQHPRGSAASHHLEAQRRHPQLPWLGGHQRKSWITLVIFFLGHWIWLHLTDDRFKGTSFNLVIIMENWKLVWYFVFMWLCLRNKSETTYMQLRAGVLGICYYEIKTRCWNNPALK